MSVGQLITRGRIAAERLMVDTCAIERVTGQSVGAGGVITATTTSVYSGKCRITSRDPGGSWMDVGEETRVVAGLTLWLPVAAPELAEGDRVTVTASAYDPQLVGKTYAVRDVSRASLATRREVEVISIAS